MLTKRAIVSIPLLVLSLQGLRADADRFTVARRLPGGPIIRPELLQGKDGANINGRTPGSRWQKAACSIDRTINVYGRTTATS